MQEVGENETEVTEFVLVGWSGRPKARMGLLILFIVSYAVTLVGNGLIIVVVINDSRLHSPMYFFLCNLSIIDLCFSSTATPQSIVNCLVDRPVMSLPLCFSQILLGLLFGTCECLLLAVMAYDRYVAISNPLRYTLIMNKNICVTFAAMTWTTAFMVTIVPCLAKPARFCGKNEVDHLVCEFKAAFKLLCTDTSVSTLGMYFTCIFTLILPIAFIVFSYMRILIAIMRMHSDSEGGKMKAFSTCGSHLVVVVMYYGSAMSAYLIPQTKETHLGDKIVYIFYTVVTPMFNPMIYALRNQEVMGALKRLISRKK